MRQDTLGGGALFVAGRGVLRKIPYFADAIITVG